MRFTMRWRDFELPGWSMSRAVEQNTNYNFNSKLRVKKNKDLKYKIEKELRIIKSVVTLQNSSILFGSLGYLLKYSIKHNSVSQQWSFVLCGGVQLISHGIGSEQSDGRSKREIEACLKKACSQIKWNIHPRLFCRCLFSVLFCVHNSISLLPLSFQI